MDSRSPLNRDITWKAIIRMWDIKLTLDQKYIDFWIQIGGRLKVVIYYYRNSELILPLQAIFQLFQVRKDLFSDLNKSLQELSERARSTPQEDSRKEDADFNQAKLRKLFTRCNIYLKCNASAWVFLLFMSFDISSSFPLMHLCKCVSFNDSGIE